VGRHLSWPGFELGPFVSDFVGSGTSAIAGLSRWTYKSANNHASDKELQVRWKATGSVPTMAAVKQLAPVWAEKRHDMLKIRCRAGRCSESRRIQRAAPAGEEREAHESATDLEAAGADVLVWHTIAREMEDRPEEDRDEPRPARRSGCGACGDMERNNHGPKS
jgi:hypothetical protein